MKIQLVNAPLTKTSTFGEFSTDSWPPLGIMYLSSYLNKYSPVKPEISLIDGLLYGMEETIQKVINFAPDILGISSATSNSTGAYFLINKIKEKLPKTLVIMGGVHASALPEEVFKASKTDLVVIGEGEKTLLEIVETINKKKKNFEKIEGIAFSKNGKIIRTYPRQFIKNLDELPFPAHHLLDQGKYKGWFFNKQTPETIIMSTRGCPFHCFFCTDVIWKSAKPYLRVRSPENIADELEWLSKTYNIREFFDIADEFNCIESWAIDVCREIRKRKLNMTWKCQLRADKVSDELARNLAEAGCWYVHLGVESGNQKTLDGINKKITIAQVEKACRTLKKYGIKVSLLLMIFNIWDNNGRLGFEGVKESITTLNFGRHLLKKGWADFFGWSPTTPYPGARLYEFSLKHNLIPKEIIGHWEKWNNIWGVTINLPGVSGYDYTKVKVYGALLQIWYISRNMGYRINFRTFIDMSKRVLGISILFLRLVNKWLTTSANFPKFRIKP